VYKRNEMQSDNQPPPQISLPSSALTFLLECIPATPVISRLTWCLTGARGCSVWIWEVIFEECGSDEKVATRLYGHHVFEEEIQMADKDSNHLKNRSAAHDDIKGNENPGEVDGLEPNAKEISHLYLRILSRPVVNDGKKSRIFPGLRDPRRKQGYRAPHK